MLLWLRIKTIQAGVEEETEEEVVETPAEETETKEEEETCNETSNKVVVDKNNTGGVSINFGSDGKINFGWT